MHIVPSAKKVFPEALIRYVGDPAIGMRTNRLIVIGKPEREELADVKGVYKKLFAFDVTIKPSFPQIFSYTPVLPNPSLARSVKVNTLTSSISATQTCSRII
jgi:hypothetical protein